MHTKRLTAYYLTTLYVVFWKFLPHLRR